MTAHTLDRRGKLVVLFAAFAGLLFDGMELGIMPIASLSVTKSLLGSAFDDRIAGLWFARFTAALMLGAAVGGIGFGALGDRIGRTKAMGASILIYSIFAGMGAFVDSLEQMFVLRFLVGLGVGGMWPNGVALVAECWPEASRPTVAGIVGAGINVGILGLSQVARVVPITPDSWRLLFGWSAAPALLGILTLRFVPESPRWLASRRESLEAERLPTPPIAELFRPPLLGTTLLGILLGAIPLIGAWASSKWMIPWADAVAGPSDPGYKAAAQGWWAAGAALGAFFGARLAGALGRRPSYALISIGSAVATCGLFLLDRPLSATFLAAVFAQGFVTTLFFGWLPLYLPELFPTHARATGTGTAYNAGRFATAFGVFFSGSLVNIFGGDYASIGAATGTIYALGAVVIAFVGPTRPKSLD
ncbi:MAG: MFS transporter [Isosphaeraceae bacterium]|nr:MFS transporter [Isosphaeraceae bacterium]